jgi:hypothetical protein
MAPPDPRFGCFLNSLGQAGEHDKSSRCLAARGKRGDGAPKGAVRNQWHVLRRSTRRLPARQSRRLRHRAPLFSDRSALTPKTSARRPWPRRLAARRFFGARSAAAHGHVPASFWRGLLVAPGVAPAPPGGLPAREARRRRTPPRQRNASRKRPLSERGDCDCKGGLGGGDKLR